jgi:phosphoglycolate phosphatase
VAAALLEAEGRAPLSLAETHRFIGDGAGAFVARMRAARDLPEASQARLLAAFLARYESAVTLTRVYPGVPAALAALAGAGHRLALCTNKPQGPARAVLHHLGLAGFFPTLLGGDSLPQRKPDPAPLHAALAALGAGPALFVGDSVVDAETARRAGVDFLLFTEGYRSVPVADLPHRAAFDRFADLPALVARLLPASMPALDAGAPTPHS